ncbi:MAG: aldolase/citrate lyase family protein [Eubacteriales bacterium]|nr:aldolase/citrate lyase family protein [Eubacteriales bacterium]
MRRKFIDLLKGDEPFLGTFIQSASPEFIEASAYAGFQFACMDLEHTYYGVERCSEMIRAGEAAGLSMLVRVPTLDMVQVKKSLDFGATGIVFPNIDTPEQAEEAVRLCRFSPKGKRGACPGVRAAFYGKSGPDYYEQQNRDTCVIPLIETSEGVRNFDDILKVPGISAVFLGPVDLSVDMGYPGDLTNPAVMDAILTMIRKAKAAGIPSGALALSPAIAKKFFAEGLRFLSYGIDTILMYQMLSDIKKNVLG